MSGATATGIVKRGTSTLVSPKFAAGMLLQHEDLEALHTYTRDLSRLLFKSFFGCGVICGLVVEAIEDCGQPAIVVHGGVALNCTGDPIHVPKDQTILINEDCDPNPDTPLWVILCPTAKCCGPRPSMCSCDDEEPSSSCTRERYGYEIRVVGELPACACQCTEAKTDNERKTDADSRAHKSECGCVYPKDRCYAAHYAGECKCSCGDCTGGGCDCVMLAQLDYANEEWTVDHSVRRFVRPVLIRDPQVAIEREARVKMSSANAMVAAPGRGQAAPGNIEGVRTVGTPKPATRTKTIKTGV